MRLSCAISTIALLVLSCNVNAFTISSNSRTGASFQLNFGPAGKTMNGEVDTGFIATELRGAAMKLHTKSQAPKEGQVEDVKPAKPHDTTHMDYLKFLVNSQHVYRAMEEIVMMDELPELAPFVNTGLERTDALEKDIEFMCAEYELERPEVGDRGIAYAKQMHEIAEKGSEGVPEFMCHYYNHYFAHTAGGMMIGKMMSEKLLDKKTLNFYKWDGNIAQIKKDVKQSIEDLAAKWSREEKDRCVDATMAAFSGGGGLNAYLGGQ